MSSKPFVTESFVDAGIDISRSRDHFAVGVKFIIKQSYTSNLVKRRKAIGSRTLMKDPVAAAAFVHHMQWAPRAAWHVHAHDHHYHLIHFVREAVTWYFKPVPKSERKPWLSDDTWSAMTGRKECRARVVASTDSTSSS